MRAIFSVLIFSLEAFFVSHDHKQAAAPKAEEDHSGKNCVWTVWIYTLALVKVEDDVKTLKLLENLDKKFEFGEGLEKLLNSEFNSEIEDVLKDVKDAFYTDNFYDQDDYLSYFWKYFLCCFLTYFMCHIYIQHIAWFILCQNRSKFISELNIYFLESCLIGNSVICWDANSNSNRYRNRNLWFESIFDHVSIKFIRYVSPIKRNSNVPGFNTSSFRPMRFIVFLFFILFAEAILPYYRRKTQKPDSEAKPEGTFYPLIGQFKSDVTSYM